MHTKLILIKHLATKLVPWLISGLVIVGTVFLLIRPMRASEGMWRIFDDVHTVRTQEMVYELQRGQFPVRLLSRLGNGGGYLLFNFYSPFTYYLTAVLVFLGTSALNATKLMFQLAYVLAAFGMFGFLRVKFPKDWLVPLLGSVLLISSPYFNYDAYTRGALGELLGFALIPWVFLSFELLKTTKQWFWSLVLAVLIALQLFTHAISAFITLPFLALYFAFSLWHNGQRQIFLQKLVLAGLVCFGLSATYFLPMWFEKSSVQYAQAEFVASGYKSGFLAITELLGLSRASDPSIKPMTLGLLLTIVGLFSWVSLLIRTQHRRSAAFFAICLGLCLVILTALSEPLWRQSSLLQMAQFPYRYLIITTFILVWLIVAGIAEIHQRILKSLVVVAVFALALVQHAEFAQVSGYYFVGEFKAEDPCTTTTWQAEYLPKHTSLCLTKSNPAQLASASGTLTVLNSKPIVGSTAIAIETNGQPGQLYIGKYAYPGWQLTTSTGHKPLQPFGPEGIFTADISAGETQFELSFVDTPIRKIGNWLTVLTAAITLLGLLRFWPWRFLKKTPQQ